MRKIEWSKFELQKSIGSISIDRPDEDDEENEDGMKSGMMIPIPDMPPPVILQDRVILLADSDTVFTVADVNLVDSIDGVEAIRVISKYCISVIIGKLFDPEEVTEMIDDALGVNTPDNPDLNKLTPEQQEKIIAKIDELEDKTEHWAIYVFPNGQIYGKSFDSAKDLKEGKEEFKNGLGELSSGICFFSDEYV